MIPGSQFIKSHGQADVAMLFQMWADGASAGEIASRFGVSISTVNKWRSRYKLPARKSAGTPEYAAPSPQDEAASLGGLRLSPWVEERARECRERHYAERRGETDETTLQWRRGGLA